MRTIKLNQELVKYLKINLAGDVLGEAASDGSVSRGAISYSLGSNGGYALKDENVINN